MRKHRYIFKNLLFLLIPLLVPILILGSLAILITQHYVKDEINKKNVNLLIQTRDNLELILNEMDTLSLNFQNESITLKLKEILNTNAYTYDQMMALNIIRSFTSSPAYSRPFIHSIYVYYNNPNQRFITSTEGLVTLDHFYDHNWYDSYTKDHPSDSWLELRHIDQYSIGKTPVVSIFRKIPTSSTSANSGVIVMNILPGEIQKMLAKQVSQDQLIMVVNNDGKVLFQSDTQTNLSKQIDLQEIALIPEEIATITINQQKYTVTHIQSGRPGLMYISLIPQDILYRIPILLSKVTIVLLIISLFFGVMITFLITRKNNTRLKNILTIIKSAEKGKPMPEVVPSLVNDEYDFILQNIIKTFIEQSYLKIQLSERTYRLRFMEMLALQSQINPHFLYNTLENIYWKTISISGKPNEASTMIEHLGDILKYALDDPSNQMVSLQTETEYVKTYLEIQKIRYAGKFAVIWDMDEGTQAASVPKLLLQPLIENSIYHGIKEKQGKSSIKIKTRHKNSMITICIIDSGIGMTHERKKELYSILEKDLPENQQTNPEPFATPTGNIGLFNTNKRLKLTYGEQYGLRILSKLGWGTAVQMQIPIIGPAKADKFVS